MKKKNIINAIKNISNGYNVIARLRAENQMLLNNEEFRKIASAEEIANTQQTIYSLYAQMTGTMFGLTQTAELLNKVVKIENRSVIVPNYTTTYSWYETKYMGTLEYEEIVLIDKKTGKVIK